MRHAGVGGRTLYNSLKGMKNIQNRRREGGEKKKKTLPDNVETGWEDPKQIMGSHGGFRVETEVGGISQIHIGWGYSGTERNQKEGPCKKSTGNVGVQWGNLW